PTHRQHSFPTRRSSDLVARMPPLASSSPTLPGSSLLPSDTICIKRVWDFELSLAISTRIAAPKQTVRNIPKSKNNIRLHTLIFTDRKSTRLNSSHQIIS